MDPIQVANPCLSKSLCSHYIGVDRLELFMTILKLSCGLPKRIIMNWRTGTKPQDEEGYHENQLK